MIFYYLTYVYNLIFVIFPVSEKNANVSTTFECVKQITFDGSFCRVHGRECFPNKALILKKRKVYDPEGEYKLTIM